MKLTPTQKACEMYETLMPMHRRMAQRKGEEWTEERDLALAEHCAKVCHTSTKLMRKEFALDGEFPY